MTPRQRVLTALDGGIPDRIPCALGFYHVELERLAPPGDYRDDLVDVHFVQAPLSPGEEAFAKQVANLPFDTRLGTPGQILTYKRWDYRPEDPGRRNPWRMLARLTICTPTLSPKEAVFVILIGCVRRLPRGTRGGWPRAATFPTWAESCSSRRGGCAAWKRSS